MTLQELIKTNGKICSINVDVRDYKENSARLIQSYHIGPYEDEDRYFTGTDSRWITIRKPINYKDVGKDYWGVFTKNIPKNLLQLQVKWWDLWEGWSTNNGLNKHMMLMVHVSGNGKEIIMKEECPVLEKNTQLDGQMQIEDFPEVLP